MINYINTCTMKSVTKRQEIKYKIVPKNSNLIFVSCILVIYWTEKLSVITCNLFFGGNILLLTQFKEYHDTCMCVILCNNVILLFVVWKYKYTLYNTGIFYHGTILNNWDLYMVRNYQNMTQITEKYSI